jgi:hypothetical protein
MIDGVNSSKEDLPLKIEEAKSKGKTLKEISPGVWKSLQELKG